MLRYARRAVRAPIFIATMVLAGCVEPRITRGPALEEGEVALVFFVRGQEIHAYVVEEGGALERAVPVDTDRLYLFVYPSIEAARVRADVGSARSLLIDPSGKKGQPLPTPARILTKTYATTDDWAQVNEPPSQFATLTIECEDGALVARCGCDVEADSVSPEMMVLPTEVELEPIACPFGEEQERCALPTTPECLDPLQRWDVATSRCVDLGPCSADWPTTTGPTIYLRAGSVGGMGTQASPVGTLSEAVGLSSPGSTIAIAPGTYPANVPFPSDLTVIGVCARQVRLVGNVTITGGTSVRLSGITLENAALTVAGALQMDAVAAVNVRVTSDAFASLTAMGVAFSSSDFQLLGDATFNEVGIVSAEAMLGTLRVMGGATSLTDSVVVAGRGAFVADTGRLTVTRSVFVTDLVGVETRGAAELEVIGSALQSQSLHAIEHVSTGPLTVATTVAEARDVHATVMVGEGRLTANDLTLSGSIGLQSTGASLQLADVDFVGGAFLVANGGSIVADRVEARVSTRGIDATVDDAHMEHIIVQATAQSTAPAIAVTADGPVVIDAASVQDDFSVLVSAVSAEAITVSSLTATQSDGVGAALALEAPTVTVQRSSIGTGRPNAIDTVTRDLRVEDTQILSTSQGSPVRLVRVMPFDGQIGTVRILRADLVADGNGSAVSVQGALNVELSNVTSRIGSGTSLELGDIALVSLTEVRVEQTTSDSRSVGVEITGRGHAMLDRVEILGVIEQGTGLRIGTRTSSIVDVRIVGWHSAFAFEPTEPSTASPPRVEDLEITSAVCGYCARPTIALDRDQVCGGTNPVCSTSNASEAAACSAPSSR